jgi:hypothetical protein
MLEKLNMNTYQQLPEFPERMTKVPSPVRFFATPTSKRGSKWINLDFMDAYKATKPRLIAPAQLSTSEY